MSICQKRAACLRAMRRRARLRRAELAHRVGISDRHVRRLEAGHVGISDAIFDAWCEACGYSVDLRIEPRPAAPPSVAA